MISSYFVTTRAFQANFGSFFVLYIKLTHVDLVVVNTVVFDQIKLSLGMVNGSSSAQGIGNILTGHDPIGRQHLGIGRQQVPTSQSSLLVGHSALV